MIDYDQICRVARRIAQPPRFDWRDLAQESAMHALMGRKSITGPMQDLMRHGIVGKYRRVYGNQHQIVSLCAVDCRRYASADRNESIIMPRFQRLLDALTPSARTVLRLRYWDDLSNVKIAKKMGLHESRIAQIHTEAIQKLRRLIQ